MVTTPPLLTIIMLFYRVFFLVLLKVICLFGRDIFILETIKGSHLNTYTGGFWYSMCKGLSGTPQKQANSYFMTLKISRISKCVYILRLIYGRQLSSIPSEPFNLYRCSVQPSRQSCYSSHPYTWGWLTWPGQWGEHWACSDDIHGHGQSVTLSKITQISQHCWFFNLCRSCLVFFVVCLTVMFTLNIKIPQFKGSNETL